MHMKLCLHITAIFPICYPNNISPIKDFLRLLQGNMDSKISQGAHNVIGVHLTWNTMINIS